MNQGLVCKTTAWCRKPKYLQANAKNLPCIVAEYILITDGELRKRDSAFMQL